MQDPATPTQDTPVQSTPATPAPSGPAAEQAAEQAAQNAPAPAATGPLEVPEWVPTPVADLWASLEAQPWLAGLVVVALAFVAAKIIEFIVTKGIARLASKTETDLDDKVIEVSHRPVFLSVFFLGLAASLRAAQLPDKFVLFTGALLKTLLVIVWLVAGFRVLRLVLEALSRNRRKFPIVEERTIPLFDMLGKLLLLGGASYAVLLIWGINPTAWLASAGVLGIAVGFAAKDTLANLFGGLFIVADAPYKIGDFVVLDTGERGQVTHVGIRSTRLLTRDDVEVTVPNAIMANAKIINESGGPWEKQRIRVRVGVAYGSDVDEVCRILEETARAHEHVCDTPEPRVRFRNFGDSSLDFELLCWITEPVQRGLALHEMNMAVYKAFAREGIEIPFPQRDLHIKQMPGQESS